ncbi:MAG: UDP-N-acetylmuramoyl-tripeptide--D-alanyl-D-alanine ligase [Corynebacterium sp.]|nr:UDP-N-acetylmuramoyl-tripeptide--D-alanyl-D-alanine ligase [Corynebacterium sp.]
MIPLSLREIASITGGVLVNPGAAEHRIIGNVEFDSRKINPGDLFLAIPGARVDGHDFLDQVAAQGAVAALVARPIPDAPLPVIQVPLQEARTDSYANAHDSDGSVNAILHALAALAGAVVRRLQAEGLVVIGLTGSAGKTSTKDMLACVCGAVAPTVAPAGSFNNEIGHPYTALKVTEDTRYLVAEMSARGLGHVAQLATISPPNVGVELNVGTAHLGEFGSQDVIAQAKGELVEALPSDGVAVLNADDPNVWGMRTRTQAAIWAYTTKELHAELQEVAEVVIAATNITFDALARPGFDVQVIHGGKVTERTHLQLGVVGEHQVANALAALAGGLAAGVEFADAIAALANHTTRSPHRMELIERAGIHVLDDAYNANPESMYAGLKAAQRFAQESGELYVILGPMNEAGESATHTHFEIGEALASYGVAGAVILDVNADSAAYIQGAQASGVAVQRVTSAEEAGKVLASKLQAGDVVYLKASNSFQLWNAITELRE